MNRAGLLTAAVAAALIGATFAIFPQFDLDLSALFFNPQTQTFKHVSPSAEVWISRARDASSLLLTVIAAPAVFAIIGKLILPGRRMLVSGRAALFVLVTLILGPFLVTNVTLKQYWGRARPIDVVQFAGTDRFTPWWDPRGPCPSNCSFPAGEPSAAFWTMAPAALAPPMWRPWAYGAALTYGAVVSLMRISAGGHFFSDTAFAGVITFLIIWICYGAIYRWRLTRLSDSEVEQALARAGDRARGSLAALGRRIVGRTAKR
jgi:lipid A 4'-phosphatase